LSLPLSHPMEDTVAQGLRDEEHEGDEGEAEAEGALRFCAELEFVQALGNLRYLQRQRLPRVALLVSLSLSLLLWPLSLSLSFSSLSCCGLSAYAGVPVSPWPWACVCLWGQTWLTAATSRTQRL
jgi:hypothetical protein